MGVGRSLVDTLARWGQLLDEDRDAALLDVRRSIQLDSYSCGVQSAYMILRYYGRGRSRTATERALGTDEDGTSTARLLALFRKRRLKPVIKARATLADLRRGIDEHAPALVSLDDGGHWAVVYGYGRGTVYVADPSARRLRVAVPTPVFRRRWDHWAMIVRA